MKTNYKKGFAPIVLIVVLAVVAVGGGTYYYKKNVAPGQAKKAETVVQATSTPSTKATTTPSNNRGKETYVEKKYNFSFQYPSRQSTTVKVVSNNFNTFGDAAHVGYTFDYDGNTKIMIDLLSKDQFHARTKVGSFTFKNGCFIDDSTNKVQTVQQLANTGVHPAYLVGGSQMSDPAHSEYAVVTTADYIVVVGAAFKGKIDTTAIADTIKTITFQNGVGSLAVICPAN